MKTERTIHHYDRSRVLYDKNIITNVDSLVRV